jgi:hypothetical protein
MHRDDVEILRKSLAAAEKRAEEEEAARRVAEQVAAGWQRKLQLRRLLQQGGRGSCRVAEEVAAGARAEMSGVHLDSWCSVLRNTSPANIANIRVLKGPFKLWVAVVRGETGSADCASSTNVKMHHIAAAVHVHSAKDLDAGASGSLASPSKHSKIGSLVSLQEFSSARGGRGRVGGGGVTLCGEVKEFSCSSEERRGLVDNCPLLQEEEMGGRRGGGVTLSGGGGGGREHMHRDGMEMLRARVLPQLVADMLTSCGHSLLAADMLTPSRWY